MLRHCLLLICSQPRDRYDGSFLFAEVSVDPRGREYADKLRTLLERFTRIGHKTTGRRPELYIPELGYTLTPEARARTRDALLDTTYVFIIVTRELCACPAYIADMKDAFGDIFDTKRCQQKLVPVFASHCSDDHIPLDQLPFGFDSVVGINVSDIAAPRTLIDIDAQNIKAKKLDWMYIQRFCVLLDPSQRRRRRPCTTHGCRESQETGAVQVCQETTG